MNSEVPATMGDVKKFTGFWPRVGASLIDTLILLVITLPILISVYGWDYFDDDSFIMGFADFFMNWLFPLAAVLAFWIYKQATPGKMAISAIIVDAKTGGKPTLQQYIVRYIGYYLAAIPLGLGFFWVAWDKKKQGWHDKLAGTVVISPKNNHTQEVSFESQ
ncbi:MULTISPECIES: RDD family protein [unclassified Arsukibacterium]|uniref:RDD family protein n=1 Tax=unclassified Arsukibacterium TaxID=2635278 RepID=UPI000C43839C|nr:MULTISPECIES: RDD family protein [unclassified Arsukibacterium]MAA95816.1 RDD family protein [Rheinheimera sp.]MAD74241.1 RDD family protein [Rheinheimera sp.]MBM33592.1 RDD family protein [Rheinheimera sp.]HAW92823.1 RDD family protein [Candidatus Azambacteria bacterium]